MYLSYEYQILAKPLNSNKIPHFVDLDSDTSPCGVVALLISDRSAGECGAGNWTELDDSAASSLSEPDFEVEIILIMRFSNENRIVFNFGFWANYYRWCLWLES
jgi:hypothetical protein